MALDIAQKEGANDFILCLNALIPGAATLAEAIAYLVSEDGLVKECILALDGDWEIVQSTDEDGTVITTFTNPSHPTIVVTEDDANVTQNQDGSWTIIDDEDNVINIPAPKLCNMEYVDYDPSIHGDKGDGKTIIAGDGSVENPFQVPRPPDVCDEIQGFASMPCNGSEEVITASCEAVPAAELANRHALAHCTGEDINHVGAGDAPPPPEITSVRELDRGWPGILDGGNSGLVNARNTIPADGVTINIPASTPGCTLMLQVSWSTYPTILENNSGIGAYLAATPTGATGISNFSRADHSETYLSTSTVTSSTSTTSGNVDRGGSSGASVTAGTSQDVYIMDSDGTGAGTVELTFPNQINPDSDPLLDGALVWHWVEVCGVTAGDFAAAVQVSSTTNGTTAPGAPAVGTGELEAYDPGGCDAVFFSFGRHTQIPGALNGPGQNPDAQWPADNDWQSSTNSAFTEIYDASSYDLESRRFYACQIGTHFGWQPGGSGATGFNYLHTLATPVSELPTRGARGVWLPLTCTTSGATAETFPYEGCETQVTNPNCSEGAVRNTVEAKIRANVPEGAEVAVTPVVNGTALTARQMEFVGPQKMCQVLSFSHYFAGVVAPGEAVGAQTLSWLIDVIEPGGQPDDLTIDIESPELCTEVIPV